MQIVKFRQQLAGNILRDNVILFEKTFTLQRLPYHCDISFYFFNVKVAVLSSCASELLPPVFIANTLQVTFSQQLAVDWNGEASGKAERTTTECS